MQIKLKRIILENYKCFPSKEIVFFQKTEISGRNRQGKSTVMNAYMEVITGKESNGSMPDGVRPHDENGEDIPKVDVIRELSLEIDGKPTTIRKITKQKWKRPHKWEVEVFDGNVTTYEIDGFASKKKDFDEFMEKIAKPDILLMCSNANPFLSILQKSTAEARKILEKLAGFDLDEFIRDMGTDYAEIAEICKGHAIEDTLKKLRKQLVDQKKKIEAQNTKIGYERTRGNDTPKIEAADLDLAKGEWQEKLAGLDAQEKALDEAVKAYDDLSAEIRELKAKASDFKYRANESIVNQRVELRAKISELETQKRVQESDLRNAQHEFERAKKDGEQQEKIRDSLLKEWEEETDKEFIWKEDSDICSFSEKPCEFIKSRNDEHRKRAEEDFNTHKKNTIQIIEERGNKSRELLRAAQEKEAETKKKISEIQQEIQKVSAEIERLNAELAKLPQEVDLSGNAEYQQLLSRIEDKEVRLTYLNNGSEQRSILRQQRNEYLAEISKIDSQIQKQIADEEEKERRIAELEAELRDMSQIAADIERQIDMVMNFSIQKNAALAEKINPYFDAFDFVFIGMTNDGNIYETLRIVRGGTDYFNGLNYSDRILCDISLVCGLQKLNGLNLPVWVDNTESVNAERLPEIEQQMILLRVSDGELQVKEII